MFKRAAAFRRPSVSADQAAGDRTDMSRPEPRDGLTRAQARALSRCAPLTPAEFRARGRVADQGLVALRGVLDEGGDAARR